jgi:glycerophosphoryl diester phosphodiesterase
MLIFGHRGAAARAPENTAASLDQALAAGADGVEIDIQRSRDGVLFLFHDETLGRTTNGQGRPGDLDWAELARLDAGSWFGPEFAGLRLLRLEEALERINGRARLLIELKNPARYPGIETELVALLRRYDALAWVEGHSFDRAAVERLATLAPALAVKWTCADFPAHLPKAPLGLSLRWEAMAANPAGLAAWQAAGRSVYVWTVNDATAAATCAALGIAGIISDDPGRLRRALRTG